MRLGRRRSAERLRLSDNPHNVLEAAPHAFPFEESAALEKTCSKNESLLMELKYKMAQLLNRGIASKKKRDEPERRSLSALHGGKAAKDLSRSSSLEA